MSNGFWIIITIIIFCYRYFTNGEKSWSYDIYDIKITNNASDMLECKVYLGKISRGVYGIDGFYNILQDVDDRAFFEFTLYYSSTGGSMAYYTKTPLGMPRLPLTTIVNKFYMPLLMDSVRNCTESAMYFEDVFVAPLTKRYIKLNKCQINADKFPDRMAFGYYKLEFTISGLADAELVFYSHVYAN